MFIHLDSDIINDPAFNENLPPEVRKPESDRDYVANKLAIWLDRASFGEADQHRYVSGVAVQSTETWCLALFGGQLANIEALEGDMLGVAFNTALLASESNPDAQVAGVPKKNRNRRERYVDKQATSAGLQRAMSNSPSFQRAFSTLKRSAEQIVPREQNNEASHKHPRP